MNTLKKVGLNWVISYWQEEYLLRVSYNFFREMPHLDKFSLKDYTGLVGVIFNKKALLYGSIPKNNV